MLFHDFGLLCIYELRHYSGAMGGDFILMTFLVKRRNVGVSTEMQTLVKTKQVALHAYRIASI